MRIGTNEIVRESPLPRYGYRRIADIPSTDGVGGKSDLDGTVANRRTEARVHYHRVCEFELCESIDEDTVVIQQGEAYTLNRSAHGVLLLMGAPPHRNQLLELHIPESWWRHSMTLFEVQWTKPVQVESQGELFLVGCRLMFGPSRYWTF
jgi:hypothetical protein